MDKNTPGTVSYMKPYSSRKFRCSIQPVSRADWVDWVDWADHNSRACGPLCAHHARANAHFALRLVRNSDNKDMTPVYSSLHTKAGTRLLLETEYALHRGKNWIAHYKRSGKSCMLFRAKQNAVQTTTTR